MEQSDYFIPPKVHQKIEICLNNTSDISDLASNLSSNNSSLGNISFEMDTSSGLPNINQFLNDNFVNDYLSKDKIPYEYTYREKFLIQTKKEMSEGASTQI